MKGAEISIVENDSDVILHPSGYLDHFVTSELETAFKEIVEKRAKPRVLVDLTDVERVDAEAMGILVKAERDLKKRGIKLKVMGANSAVQNAFRLLGISHLLIT